MKRAPTSIVVATVWLSLAGAAGAPAAGPPGWERHREDVDRALDDAERELRKLEKRLDALAGEARARLEQKRRLVERRLAEMRARSDRAWKAVRPELERALDELRKALREPAPDPDVTRT